MITKSFPLTAVPGDEQGSQSLLKSTFSGWVEMLLQESLLIIINLLPHYGNSANLHPD